MNWIDYEYPNTAYIVEVWYKRRHCENGDIAIATCRCKEMPKERDHSRGFTKGFWNYARAVEYAQHVAAELGIPTAIKTTKEEQKMKRVYRLVILEIVNFDEIETLDEAKYDLVGVIEAPSSDECFEKANAAFDDDRFVWWSHDF